MRYLLIVFAGICCLYGCRTVSKEQISSAKKPNVLFIAVDDMNDWVGFLDGYPNVKTPNFDKLASMGVSFSNAHTPSPLCGPSRASILSGKYPHKTGIYGNGQWWRPNYPDMVTIPMHFKNNGYHVAGAGKIFHHTAGFNPPDQWHEFRRMDYDDPWDRESRQNYPWTEVAQKPDWHPLHGLPFSHEFDWGVIPGKKEEDYGDSKTIKWCSEFLENYDDSKPFFLAAGLFHPHMPWYVPQKYLGMYPIDEIVLPEVLETDLDDIPEVGQKFAAAHRNHLNIIRKADKMKEAIQAYLASISYADAQIGKLINTLEESGKAKNTIIVLWSDHGWHLGEKDHFYKGTLWERSTRVPFVIATPDMKNAAKTCSSPVSLVSIFKTLNELCDLPELQELDGSSLVPLLADTKTKIPALICYQKGNFALQDERFHYIQYHDGTEELYDHSTDKNEWYNIANSGNKDLLNKFRNHIPKDISDDIPGKSDFEFDYQMYSWTRKSN